MLSHHSSVAKYMKLPHCLPASDLLSFRKVSRGEDLSTSGYYGQVIKPEEVNLGYNKKGKGLRGLLRHKKVVGYFPIFTLVSFSVKGSEQ